MADSEEDEKTLALMEFFTTFDTDLLANDIGPHLTCGEVEIVANLFRVHGMREAAEAWISGHAVEDDEGDEHYGMADDD